MKRKLPSHIKVGGHTIAVVRQKNLLSHSEAYGMFDPTGLVITIDDSLSNTLAWETLWHEVTEALNFFAEADMEHKSIQVFGLLLHQIVDSIFVKAKK